MIQTEKEALETKTKVKHTRVTYMINNHMLDLWGISKHQQLDQLNYHNAEFEIKSEQNKDEENKDEQNKDEENKDEENKDEENKDERHLNELTLSNRIAGQLWLSLPIWRPVCFTFSLVRRLQNTNL